MSFVDAIKSVFTQYAGFSGRARRSEYWFFCLFNIIVSVVFSVLTQIGGNAFSLLSTVFSLAVLLPSIAVCIRRLHDIGKSGWFYLFVLIPLVGSIILIVWFCKDSEPGANMWGPNPKEDNSGFGHSSYSGNNVYGTPNITSDFESLINNNGNSSNDF